MKVSQAEELICPFMSTDNPRTLDWIKCQTTKCMAWKMTEQYRRTKQGNATGKLELKDCEGYCQRLSNDY